MPQLEEPESQLDTLQDVRDISDVVEAIRLAIEAVRNPQKQASLQYRFEKAQIADDYVAEMSALYNEIVMGLPPDRDLHLRKKGSPQTRKPGSHGERKHR